MTYFYMMVPVNLCSISKFQDSLFLSYFLKKAYEDSQMSLLSKYPEEYFKLKHLQL